jgi:hypothetical protein
MESLICKIEAFRKKSTIHSSLYHSGLQISESAGTHIGEPSTEVHILSNPAILEVYHHGHSNGRIGDQLAPSNEERTRSAVSCSRKHKGEK